jgi:hypothetical protein
MNEMIGELAERVESVVAPRSAHWISEENPQFLADAILQRIGKV